MKLTILLLLILTTLLYSQDLIRITLTEYPPYTSQNLPKNGIMCEIITKALLYGGVKAEFRFYPDARAILLAKTGAVDASMPWAKRDERLPYFYYGEPLMESDKEVFFHRKDFTFKWDPKKQDYSQLKGIKIVAILSNNYGEKFQQAEKDGVIDVVRISTTQQALKMVAMGRLNLFISPSRTGQYDMKKHLSKDQHNSLKSTLAIERAIGYDYLIISKKSKHGKHFLKAMNFGLRKMKKSGEYQKMMKTHFN